MAYTCNINIIEEKFKKSLSSEDKVKQTLSSLLEEGADIEDIVQVVTAPISSRILRTLKPEVKKFIGNEQLVRDFLGSPKKIDTPNPTTKPYKEQEIDNPDEIIQNGKRAKTWIHDAWGIASSSKLKFIQNIKREFNDRVVRVIREAENPEIGLNTAIQNYFTFNLNELRDFFIRIGKPDYAKIISDNMPFDNGVLDPHKRITTIIKEISPYFSNISDQTKIAYTQKNNSQNDIAKAFSRFLLIQPLNFDNFIKSYYKTYSIRNLGKLSNSINKYGIQIGNGKGNHSWQDEEREYKISRMVDDSVQSEVETWPIYRKINGVWTKQEDEFCDLNKVVGVFSKLKNISNLKNSKLFIPYIYEESTSELFDDLKQTFETSFGINIKTKEPIIDSIINEYIEGKTLPEIIQNMERDPHHLVPIVMYLLTKETGISNSKSSIVERAFKDGVVKFESNEVEIIHSIWNNMFNPLNSKSLYNSISNNNYDMYQMLTQVLLTHEKKDMYGIVNDMETVDKKYYSIGKANQRLNQLQSKINGHYSPLVSQKSNFITIENNFQQEHPYTTITYKVPAKPITYTFKVTEGNKIEILRNGKELSKNISEIKDNLNELKKFFEDTIRMDFSSNERGSLLNIYMDKMGNNPQTALRNLVDISTGLIYANEVSKFLQNESTSDFKNQVKTFYANKTTPKLVRGVTYNQIDAFSGKLFPLFTKLSLANDIHEGIVGDIVVKGGKGELINSVMLHTLVTNFGQFVREKMEDPESAIKDFSISKVLKRMSFLRDYVDKTGDVKSAISMNVEEFFINGFIYDFYGDDIALPLGVLSDKPNIVKMELGRDLEITVGDKPKKLKDCTTTELKKVAIKELGEYYLRMKNEMDRNLAILTKYSPSHIIYSLDNDYEGTRGYTRKQIEEDIHNAIYAAQQAGKNIEINELLYFSWNKLGQLHVKPSLIGELAKHDVQVGTFGLKVENSKQFFDRKESELVTDLLQDLSKGISFIDQQSQKVIDSPAVKKMLAANRIKEENGSIAYGKINNWATKTNIIIGKILFGDEFVDLINKKSLSNWYLYKNLHNYIDNNPKYDVSKLDINQDFDFQYFLKVLSKLYPKLQKESFLKKTIQDLKTKVETKLNKSTSKINKNVLIKNYKEWRKEHFPEETESELNQKVLEYETETDERKWRLRDTSLKMEQLKDITSLEEVKSLAGKFGVEVNTDFQESSSINFSLKINPEIQKYNTLHYLFSEEGLNSTVGSHINHKAGYMTDLKLLGAIETGQQAKRNVSLSGSKNQYTRGDIKGLGRYMTIACVQDVKNGIFTVNGVENPKAATVMDGSTIGNYITREEEHYSLGCQKSGEQNAKPLGNDLNPKTGTGTIIKTAVFYLTNARIRNSERNIIIHKHMNNIPWHSNFDGNFLQDFNGKEIKYKPVIVYKPSTNSYYLRTNFTINEDGTTSFNEIEINNEVLKVNVGKGVTIGSLIRDGYDISPYLNTIQSLINPKLIGNALTTITTSRPIRTNYELWDLFGGAYSASINLNNELSYKDDNTSLDNLTTAAHSCGIRINEGVIRPTNQDVWLPIKESKIDWLVTEGAIKQGASNMNSTALFTDINYPVTTQKIATADVGMQLNPEHEADKSHVTLMTQVVNALGLKGFSADAANRCYQALATLTDFSLKDLFKGIEVDLESGDNTEFQKAVATLLLRSIAGTTETDGDLVSSIVIQLNKQERNGNDYEVIRHRLPISDPAILNKLISNFSSLMTKAGVRIQFPGGMNVLVPSDGIYRIHGGKLKTFASTQRYDNDLIVYKDSKGNIIPTEAEVEQQRLQELQNQQQPLEGLHAITIGASYFIRIKDFNGIDSSNPLITDILANKSIKIDDLTTYYKLRDLLNSVPSYTITEDIISGRELAPYNCIFNTDKGKFMLWDMDSIKHTHMIKQNPTKVQEIFDTYTDEQIYNEFHINPQHLNRDNIESFTKSFEKLINIRKQIELNSIGSGNENDVYINGERVFVDKSTLQVSPYELIAPKNYATDFGLRIGDDLSEIANDKLFFLKRILKTFYKQENGHWIDQTVVSPDQYDLILKTVSGKHYPILFKTQNSIIPKGLEKISDEEFYTRISWEGSKLYWLDGEGNKLYEIPYEQQDGKVIYKAEILTDAIGNEVIYTSDIKSFINKIPFNNIDFGQHILNTSYISDIIKELEGSKKRSVQNLYNEYSKNLLPINEDTDPQNLPMILSQNETSLKEQISTYLTTRDQTLSKIDMDILSGNINSDDYTGIFKQMIISSIETHTSFLKSLEYIVSRTPAQSHQSFMPMKLVAFDDSGKNSAYVNRWQLYLQGSDYDVDKASLLGSIFINGKYVKWSPFMDLSSIEALKASETLPFPSGKELQFVDSLDKRIYDKMDKPIHLIWENDRVTFSLPGKIEQYHLTKDVNGIWITDLTVERAQKLTPSELYFLERAIVDKVPEGEQFFVPFHMDMRHLGIINGVKDSTQYDYYRDLEQYLNTFAPLFNMDENGKYSFVQTPENIKQLAILINSLNTFEVFPTVTNSLLQTIKQTVDQHNTFFNDNYSIDPKDAVVNYISSLMYQISSNPVNLVQGMTSVDQLTETTKDIAKESPLAKQSQHFDKGNIMSTFRLLRLTLSGKQDTGIEASSLKVMEAINQYQDQILNYGSDEEQKSLITPINIGGYSIQMICNAYCKNIANIKSKEVYDALQTVDNNEDQALWLSAFLSLSTDNAKDPTLSKINANPEMIGLYNAGFVLGLPINFLTKVIMSSSGMALAKIQQGNVFLGLNSYRNLSRVLEYIDKGPIINPNKITLDILTKAINAQYGEKEINSFNLVKSLLPNQYSFSDLMIARRIIGLAKSLAYGEQGKEVEYNLPTLEQRVSRELVNKKKQLSKLNYALQATENAIQEANSLNKKHKRLDNDKEKISKKIADLQIQIEELQNIKTSYKLGYELPSGNEGSKYEEYHRYEQQLKSLKEGNQSGVIRAIESFKESVKQSANFKKTLSELESYLDTIEEIQFDEKFEGVDGAYYYPLQVIRQLNQFASEMSLIRPNLTLNQQLPNSKENQINFVKKFENIIYDRLSSTDIKETQELKELAQLNDELGKEKYAIDLVNFVWKEDYRNAAIKAYESIKYKVNVLDLLLKVPHYFGYLKSCSALYKSLQNSSLQYREQDRIAETIIRGDLGIKNSKNIQSRLKLASRYISRQMNNMFLNSQNVELTIPKIVDGVVDDATKISIKLGTKEGNQAFKEWMDLVIIPKYKTLYSSTNRFFKELHEAAYHKTDGRNTQVNFTTGIDIMSSNTSEINKVAEVTEAFNRLATKEEIKGLPIVNLFFYYDLIAYDRQPGQYSLTPIFNQLVALNNTDVLTDYVAFVSDLDQSGNYILSLDPQQIDEIERFIAPSVSIYALDTCKEKYAWVKDPLDSKFYLIEKIQKEKGSTFDEDENIDEGTISPEEEAVMSEIVGIDGIGPDEGEEGYIPLTLDSKLADLGTYNRVTFVVEQNNPYMKEFSLSKAQTILEGQGVIDLFELKLGDSIITIDYNGEPIIDEKARKKLIDITGQQNVDDLIVSKIQDGRSVIDIETTKANLENPCK